MFGQRREVKGGHVCKTRANNLHFRVGHSSFARLISQKQGYYLSQYFSSLGMIGKWIELLYQYVSSFLSDSAILGSTQNDEISESKKLLLLL